MLKEMVLAAKGKAMPSFCIEWQFANITSVELIKYYPHQSLSGKTKV